MNCDVLPKRSRVEHAAHDCVEVSLPVTPARCEVSCHGCRGERRAECVAAAPPSCGKWRIRRIAPGTISRKPKVQAKQIDHQLEEWDSDRRSGRPRGHRGGDHHGRAACSIRGAAERGGGGGAADRRLAVAVADLRGARSARWASRGRDRIAVEKPPLPGNGAIDAWRQFVIWLAEKTATLRLAELDKAVDVAAEASMTAEEGCALGWSNSSPRSVAVVIWRSSRQASVPRSRRWKKTSSDRVSWKRVAVERGHVRVASALGTHLKANNFEAWLLEEAMEVLIDGANRLLDELSGAGTR